jgi:hypothetical protein
MNAAQDFSDPYASSTRATLDTDVIEIFTSSEDEAAVPQGAKNNPGATVLRGKRRGNTVSAFVSDTSCIKF